MIKIKDKLLLIVFLLYSQTVVASEKIYIVGVEDSIGYPYKTSENGKFYGKFREILDKFAKSQGIRFEYKSYKVQDLFEALYTNKVDFKFPDNPVWKSPEKKDYKIIYSDFLTYYIDALFVKKSDIKKNFRDFKTFGTSNDSLLWPISGKLAKGKVKVIQANSCSELIPQIKNNEIEAIFCNYDVMKYILRKSSLENEIVVNTNLPFIDNYYYISTINYPEIIVRLNSWIHKNRVYIEKEMHES